MCWELFEDFQKEIKEEISKELGDCKYKINNYRFIKACCKTKLMNSS